MNGFGAMFRKEMTQMLRDRGTLMFAIAVPVFELILFGVIDMNAKNIPTAIFDQSRTQESRRLIEQFGNTSYLHVTTLVASRSELEHQIIAGHAQVAIEIPPDYARNLVAKRKANVLVMIDGSDSSVANQALSAANGVVLFNSIQSLIAKSHAEPPAEAHPVMMFNPDMRSANLLIPGLISILLTFSGTVLSAFAIVKERERGTLEQLMVTPVSPLAVVTGKLLPYLGLAYLQLLIILFLMRVLFQVPIHGSLTLLLVLSPIYLLSLLSVGLLVSSRAKTQMEAMQRAMGMLLPSVLLSGYIFPIASLPFPLRVVSYLLPATHYIRIARGIVIRGATFFDLWEPVAALLVISTVLIAASARAFQKTVT
ncbi:MAG: drug efflux transport system permease protein [Thermoanaerobaculia bacterium]|jgi:ABC-2 type transport system permease protein|nr:drug efflux transport system permease protein [Thermoanaerobaculia bacterium]